MSTVKVKCSNCELLMNEVDKDGRCIQCDLIQKFIQQIYCAGDTPDVINLAMDLFEHTASAIIDRLVFEKKSPELFIEDVYTGMVPAERIVGRNAPDENGKSTAIKRPMN